MGEEEEAGREGGKGWEGGGGFHSTEEVHSVQSVQVQVQFHSVQFRFIQFHSTEEVYFMRQHQTQHIEMKLKPTHPARPHRHPHPCCLLSGQPPCSGGHWNNHLSLPCMR